MSALTVLEPAPAERLTILKHPALLVAGDAHGFAPDAVITLRGFYERVMLPEIVGEQSGGSLKEDRIALNHWDRLFAGLDIRDVSRQHVLEFYQSLQETLAPATINKTWREIASMLRWAVDCEPPILDRVPVLNPRRKSKLCVEPPKKQREPISEAEITAIWRECRNATYPRSRSIPAPKLWRVALVLFWVYGPRTRDLFERLSRGDVRLESRRILFEAMKTRKLQGLPLTDLVIAHLDSIRHGGDRVLPGFNTKGCRLKRGGTWKRGYYTTWKQEILDAAGVTGVCFKNIRETMLTRYNGIEPGLGNWIAAHHVPGVSAQSYDMPTARIRAAIESAPVPDCFNEIG